MVAPDKLIRGIVIDEELKLEIERRYNGWDDLRQQLASLEQEVEQCCYGESLAFAAMRQQLADSQKQNASLKEALIGWRQRAWTGTDQRAVVERDYPEIVGDK